MSLRLGPWVFAACVGLSIAGSSAFVRADAAAVDDEVRTRARGLGEEGNALFDKGDYKGALDMYERAGALVNVPTLGLKAARCLDKLGRLIEASERYLTVTRMSLPADALDVHKEAIVSAEKERGALMPRIPTLIVSGVAVGSKVYVDGKEYPAALFGVKSAIDPGNHRIEAHGPDGDDSQSFAVDEGKTFRIKLSPHRLAPRPRSWMTPARGVGVASLVVGVAGLAAGIGTTVVLGSKRSSLEGPCGTALQKCPANQNVDPYNSLRAPSTVSWIVGGVFAAAGVVLIAIPSASASANQRSAISLEPTGASFSTTF